MQICEYDAKGLQLMLGFNAWLIPKLKQVSPLYQYIIKKSFWVNNLNNYRLPGWTVYVLHDLGLLKQKFVNWNKKMVKIKIFIFID